MASDHLNREVLLNRAHYVATATVGIRQGTGGEIELFFLMCAKSSVNLLPRKISYGAPSLRFWCVSSLICTMTYFARE